MNPHVTFEITTKLRAPRPEVWAWITSVKGISAEMNPYFRMTAPPDVESLGDVSIKLGEPIFRSKVFLFCVLPAGSWDFVLVELEHGHGFVENAPPSAFMTSWRHERRLLDCSGDPGSVLLTDRLRFTPRSAPGVVGPFIRHVFKHRHRVLARQFDAGAK